MGDNCSTTTLAPNASCSVTVQFAPTVSGSLSANLVAKDSAANVLASATLGGTGGGIWTAEAATLTTQQLNGVWGPNANSVYVVGAGGVILHRDATGTWSAAQSITATPPTFTGVWGSDASNLWASASNGVWSSTGNGTWNRDPNELNPTSAIWGADATHIWAVAGYIFSRNAGTGGWNTDCCASGVAPFFGLWGAAANDVYAVGQSGTSMLVYHNNGSGWTAQTNFVGISGLYQLLGIWGSSSSNIYIVGEQQTILHSTGNGTWTLVSAQNGPAYNAVWGSGPNDVYAVGLSYAHYDGTAWTNPPVFSAQQLFGIWGTAANNIYAVGANGTIYHYY
jgi:hypothetical protein